ncbi:MAG: AraC family transcriptional regulator [Bacteroidetes bacterium]|nr:MAG: AraC family transcriptional regulator [Bacteroidota bacterium]
MKSFFKYLNIGKFDKSWGLYLNVVGNKMVYPNEPYPNPIHPNGYFFSWAKGRVLTEYQINYITEGSGILETNSGVYPLKKGTLFILKPGMWHRYKPNKETGWIENYIGFNGSIADNLFQNNLLSIEKPVIDIGNREEFIDSYIKIFDIVKLENPGFQQIAAGMILKLIGYIVAFEKQKGYSGNRIEHIIKQACFTMRENVSANIDLHQIANDNHVGYAYFRKMFKKYMGISPAKYHTDLRVLRAKELLLSSDKLVKQVSNELGFQSIYYFSRLFKNKTGISPSKFRAQNNLFFSKKLK